jgi:hypothetical protein
MNDSQKFITSLKSIVEENQIHIPNYQSNENQLITEIRLSDFPDWLVALTYERFFTIFFQDGKPSYIGVEVVTGVDPLRLEVDPRNQDKSPGLPLGLIDKSIFFDHGVTEDLYSMFSTLMPPGFRLLIEEFVVNLRDTSDFKLRLSGTKPVEDFKELFYILENLSRPEWQQDWYKESVEKEMQKYSRQAQSKDKTSK